MPATRWVILVGGQITIASNGSRKPNNDPMTTILTRPGSDCRQSLCRLSHQGSPNHWQLPRFCLASNLVPEKVKQASGQFSPVAQSCLTLCDPMDRSMPGLPVHHQLPESTQTHVHWVEDVIQPSHPLSSPSLLAFSLSYHQGLFQWVSSLPQVVKVLELQLPGILYTVHGIP